MTKSIKDQRFEIRLTKYEKDILKIMADKQEMSIAEYIRSSALNRAKSIIFDDTDEWLIEHRSEHASTEYRDRWMQAFEKDAYELFDGKSPDELRKQLEEQRKKELDTMIKQMEEHKNKMAETINKMVKEREQLASEDEIKS